ncbi:UDP-glycosyltransferase 86A1-like isoform X1 [Primulina eburnea]|uniref:UDP-glycosyltransferase 86A1-like isoform X1 n=1 Tax=Primulina eburnea TaxID=1245227 RepID=UPI003C6C19A5
MAEAVEIRPHAIMIPAPYQGHINPLVDLALNLASRGFTITFVNTEFVHHLLSKSHKNTGTDEIDLFSEARKSGLDIRYTTFSDGFPLDFDRDANVVEFWEYLIQDFVVHVDELMGNIVKSCDYKPFLITDTFSSWHAEIANKYNMVNVSFWTQPALVFALDYHLDLLRKNGHFPLPKEKSEDTVTYVPGVELISTKDFMTFLHETDITVEHKLVFRAFEQIENTDFILLNTVQELEPETVPALNQILPTYAIGPVMNFSTRKIKISTTLTQQTECTEWLQSKPPASVLYISFGSFVHSTKQVIQEIAHGLLLADINFIWVVRTNVVIDSDATDVLPSGFEQKVKEKGLIVPWCDQDSVLSNPGIGGFLTHCGWNSVLEGAWHGVPMLCYPLLHDQPTNRKLVVDDWKIGINLCDGESVTRDEVAGKIKRLMCGEFREEIKKVSSVMRNSLDDGGSSEKNLERFVVDLRAKIHKVILNFALVFLMKLVVWKFFESTLRI